jgi:predicted transposase/invertase (TIGR01784 family)
LKPKKFKSAIFWGLGIAINILDFNLFEDDRFWHTGDIIERTSKERLTDLLEMHFLEMRKMKIVRNDSPITYWIEFFRDPYSETIAKLCKTIPEIREAKAVFEKAKSDPQARELIRVHEKAVRDYASDLESYLQEGLKKGLREGEEKGLKKGKEEIVIKMLEKGLPVNEIAEITEFPENEILKLKKNNKGN